MIISVTDYLLIVVLAALNCDVVTSVFCTYRITCNVCVYCSFIDYSGEQKCVCSDSGLVLSRACDDQCWPTTINCGASTRVW